MSVNNYTNRPQHDPLDETKQYTTNAFSNDYRFKSSCRVDPNDTFTPFLVWKTHITRLLLDPSLSALLSTPFARFYQRRNSNVVINRRPSAAPSLLTVLELTAEIGDDGDEKDPSLRENNNNNDNDKNSENDLHEEIVITTASTALLLPSLKLVSGKNSNRISARGGSAKSPLSNGVRRISGGSNNGSGSGNGSGVNNANGGTSRKGSEGRSESGNSTNTVKVPPTIRAKSKPKKSELLHANLKALCDKMEEDDPTLMNMLPMLHSLLGIHTSRESMDKAAFAGTGAGAGTGGDNGSARGVGRGLGVGLGPVSANLDEYANEIVPLLVRLIMCVADVLGGPLLFVIDDSQAMDSSSWALLRHLWKCCNGHTTTRPAPTTHRGDHNRASHAAECTVPHPAFRKATVAVLLTFRTMSEHHHDYNDEQVIAGS